MCEPATAFAIASVVIGNKMKYDQQQQAAATQKRLTNEELDRQKALEMSARAKNETALNKFGKENVGSEMRGQSQRLENLFNRDVMTSSPRPVSVNSGSPVIRSIEDQAMNRTRGRVMDRGKNMADLNSFGTALAALAPSITRAQEEARMSGNFMRGGSNVLKRELAEAQQDAYSPLGDLLTNLGMVGVNYSLKSDPKVIES